MRLKDKLWKVANIKIERLVKQEKEKGMTSNETIMWLVNIRTGYGRGVGFSARTPLELFCKLMSELYLN